MSKYAKRMALALLAAVFVTPVALADAPKPPPGRAMAGKGIATLKCAGCHNVNDDAMASPNLKAPPFVVIARSKLATVREVDQWLQAAHHDMPDLGLDAGQRGDVVAYLQSLSPQEPME